MNTIIASLLAAALVLVALPTATAIGAPDCVPFDGYYCVQIKDGQLCVTTHTGDLEGPRTWCKDIPSVTSAPSVDVAGCVPFEGHYCVDAKKGCVTYDVGDLEGPRTWCLKGERSTSADSLCATKEGYGACVGDGCATVYAGPDVRTEPFCVEQSAAGGAPRVCTLDYFLAAGVCIENGCTTVWAGMYPVRVCPQN